MTSVAYPNAYPVPAVEVPPPPPPHALFKSPEGRCRLVERLILGELAIRVAYAAITAWVLLMRTRAVPRPLEGYMEIYDAFAAFMLFFFLVTRVIVGIFFIFWQRQVLRNLTALGCVKIRHNIELASWSWLIPFVAWVVPYQSIAQVARHSRPQNGPNTPALVGMWWAAWLSLGLLSQSLWVMVFLVKTAEDWVRLNTFELAMIGVEVITGLLAILVMRWLTRQQVEHHQRLAGR